MPNQQPVFSGVAVGLVTFFDEHGQVDTAATANHARHLAERGMRALVVAGSTGEASHLSMKERLVLFDAVRAAVPAELPVLLGTGDLAPGVSVPDLTRRAAQHGAAAALVLSPHKGDMRSFYSEVVAAAGNMPVLAYHWPKASPPGISLDDLKAIKVAGLKDSTGDTERMLETLSCFKLPFYAGNSSVVADGDVGQERTARNDTTGASTISRWHVDATKKGGQSIHRAIPRRVGAALRQS